MNSITDQVNIRSAWRTIAVIVVVALLASPDAPLPLLGLYGVMIVFAVLLPVRTISNMTLIRSLGVVTVGIGVWLGVSSVGSRIESGAYIVVGLIAIAIPTVVTQWKE